jgi:cellulose synthase/poly-beta-1,6-N-acetylglucosamine synthase-like glycosyltransferase
MKPDVTIIVASHRPHLIEACVTCFDEACCGTVTTEVIIVADYPVEDFRTLFPQVKWMYVPDKSISLKRNEGIREAQGKICAFTDDDCRPKKGWIIRGVSYLSANPDCAGVEGKTTIEATDIFRGAYKEYQRLENQGYRTNNIFYQKHLLEKVGCFDERFTVQREDVDLAYTFLEQGYIIDFNTTLEVEHIFRKNDRWDLLKNCINRQFDPLLYAKHPTLYRYYLHSPFPTSILILLLAYCIGAVAIPLYPRLGLAIICLIAGLITVVTLRRCGGLFANGVGQWFREWLSLLLSPLVLLGALFFGSVKYRSFLIF